MLQKMPGEQTTLINPSWWEPAFIGRVISVFLNTASPRSASPKEVFEDIFVLSENLVQLSRSLWDDCIP